MIIDKMAAFFSAQNGVRFAYLFGSHAKGETGAISDIDIAVYLYSKLDKNKRFDLRLELIGQICGILKTDKVDLIVLNDSPLLLSFNAIYGGILLNSKDEGARVKFETRTMSLYFDQQYYYRRHAKMAIQQIAREGIL